MESGKYYPMILCEFQNNAMHRSGERITLIQDGSINWIVVYIINSLLIFLAKKKNRNKKREEQTDKFRFSSRNKRKVLTASKFKSSINILLSSISFCDNCDVKNSCSRSAAAEQTILTQENTKRQNQFYLPSTGEKNSRMDILLANVFFMLNMDREIRLTI